MSTRSKVEHLQRYKDLATLLIKYGQIDLVKELSLEDHISSLPVSEEAAKAEELANDLEKLGPTYVKLGQFLSTRADFLPPAYLTALERLQDNVTPITYEEVEKIVTAELGVRISKAFDHFEEKPVASASLGQVHLATLRSGRAVAVKVQRPGIREQVALDLDAFEDIAEILENRTELGRQLMLHATLQEFRKAMLRELDYKLEAQNLITLEENLSEFENIVVPLPVKDYTTSRVLTMDYVRGTNITKLSPVVRVELNGAALAEELFKAYLQQIVIDGFYHADPHPGNIFLTEDRRLALIDLGMVARLPSSLQIKMIRVLLAISEGKGELAAQYTLEMGTRLPDADEDIFRRQVSEMVDQYNESSLEEIQVGRLVLEVTRVSGINGIRLPNEMVMLAKTLLNLDKVGHTLDPSFDPNASLRRHAAALVQQRMHENSTPGRLYETLLETKEFVEQLPGRVNKILDSLANNQFTVNARTIDERFIVAGFKEIANRITLGIILAALIVGAALLMRIDTPFKIFGYPGIAIVFFLLAGLGGLTLVTTILLKKE